MNNCKPIFAYHCIHALNYIPVIIISTLQWRKQCIDSIKMYLGHTASYGAGKSQAMSDTAASSFLTLIKPG